MCLVGVQETAVLTGDERLERQLAAGGADGLSYEHLTFDGDIRSHREHMLDNLIHLSNIHCSIVLAGLDCLNLFHDFCCFIV